MRRFCRTIRTACWRRDGSGSTLMWARDHGGDLAAALGRITARTVVMPVSTDMFFTVADCAAEQRLISHSKLRVLETDWGHIGVMGMDPGYLRQVDEALMELLRE